MSRSSAANARSMVVRSYCPGECACASTSRRGNTDLKPAVGTLEEAVRAQTQATEAKTSFLDRMRVDLKDMVRSAEMRILHRLRIPAQSDHPFRRKVISHSGGK